MVRRMRKRVLGKLNTQQAAHFRRSHAEAEAEIEQTRAASREMAKHATTVQLDEVVQAIRSERLRLKLPANVVAERMQMDAGNFARLESGQGNPTIETVTRLAEAVGVELLVSVKAKT